MTKSFQHFIISVIVIFFYNINRVHAQSNVIYEEDFNSKYNSWNDVRKNGNYSDIVKGNYKIHSSEKEAIRQFYNQIFINYKKNYSIEVKIKQVQGKTNQGYGIVWGANGWKNSYFFIITSSGYFTIGEYSNGEYIEHEKWTKSKAIKPKGKYNILKLEKDAFNWIFYINGESVYTMRSRPFYGQMHGFMIQQAITCLVDYIKITNDLPEVEVASVSFAGKKKNLGTNINTSATEIAPIISPDGKTLYFARGNSKTNPNGYNDEADIWYSERQADGSWGPAKNIGKPLNNTGVNVVVNVMPDGNTMFLEGLYNSDGSFKSDQGISVTHKLPNGKWSVPKQVKIDNFYNKNIYETYFFTSDQQVLIMSIERDDSYGDLDLYVSFRRPDGSYTEPKNMGPVLNTFASDGTPFMAPDGKTLYFASAGRYGFGSEDIYMSKRLDDTWLHWSKPKNLGKNINTKNWDTYFSLSAKGDTAFLVSVANSYGNEDIFTIALSPEQQPDKVILVYGKVLDSDTHKPIGAKITYQDLTTGKQVGIANSNPTTGEYKIVLPYGKIYGFRAEAKNFVSVSDNLDLRKKGDYEEVEKNLYLTKMQVGEVIVLNNVFFDRASSQLKSTSYPELDRLIKIMKDNPKMRIELRGHTDNRGDPQKLMKLSEDRVNAVKNYLIKHGISSSRIETKAFGGSKPINKNDTEAEHAKNRRVEFKILSM